MKTCAQCNENKNLDCFYKHNTSKDGLAYKCKQCLKYNDRKRYKPISKKRWIKELKVTSKVIVCSIETKKLATIIRLTRNTICLNNTDNIFRRNNGKIFNNCKNGYYYYLEEATEETILALKLQEIK
jgi:hypothetical protein